MTPFESNSPSSLNEGFREASLDSEVSQMLPVEFFNRENFKKAVIDRHYRNTSSRSETSINSEKRPSNMASEHTRSHQGNQGK